MKKLLCLVLSIAVLVSAGIAGVVLNQQVVEPYREDLRVSRYIKEKNWSETEYLLFALKIEKMFPSIDVIHLGQTQNFFAIIIDVSEEDQKEYLAMIDYLDGPMWNELEMPAAIDTQVIIFVYPYTDRYIMSLFVSRPVNGSWYFQTPFSYLKQELAEWIGNPYK